MKIDVLTLFPEMFRPVMESSMLDETRNNFICSLCAEGKQAGICFADISTGELHATTLEGEDLEERLVNELSR